MVVIGHARGGDPLYTPGDQSGSEVCTQGWYNGGWNFVARPKSAAIAERMAAFCEAICGNQNIGYSQTRRNDLRAAAKTVNWNPAAIRRPADCDCSSFMSVCAEAGGVNMDVAYTYGNAPWTGNMRTKLALTGAFEILTEPKYLSGEQYLKRGDILVNEKQHTAMVLSNGALSGQTMPEAKNESGKEFRMGDVVRFSGGTHYVGSRLDQGYPARPGPAMITLLAPGTKHPYHLIHTDGTSNVYGWVDEGSFERLS